jgi:hypothetical protein
MLWFEIALDRHADDLLRASFETIKQAEDIAPTDDCLLSILWQKPPSNLWQKPPSKRFRQILLPHGTSRKEVRPERR